MKRRIGTIKGKPIIEGGNTNILTNNEILVQNNKIIVRKDNELKELGNSNSSNNSDSSSSRVLPSDIISIKQLTYTTNSYADAVFDKDYDISSLINYSEELGIFVISKTDYDEIKQRDSYSGELYFSVTAKGASVEYSTTSSSDVQVTTVTGEDGMPHKFYYRHVMQDSMIADFKNYKEFYLMVL